MLWDFIRQFWFLQTGYACTKARWGESHEYQLVIKNICVHTVVLYINCRFQIVLAVCSSCFRVRFIYLLQSFWPFSAPSSQSPDAGFTLFIGILWRIPSWSSTSVIFNICNAPYHFLDSHRSNLIVSLSTNFISCQGWGKEVFVHENVLTNDTYRCYWTDLSKSLVCCFSASAGSLLAVILQYLTRPNIFLLKSHGSLQQVNFSRLASVTQLFWATVVQVFRSHNWRKFCSALHLSILHAFSTFVKVPAALTLCLAMSDSHRDFNAWSSEPLLIRED